MHTELDKHITAFNAYYALGANRKLSELHSRYTELIPGCNYKPPSLPTLKNWSRFYSWQERILLRDTEISKNVEKKILKAEEDTRINSYTKILELRDTLLATLGTAFYKDKNGKNQIHPDIGISSARELRDIALGALKCETEALHILSPEPLQEPSTVTITIKSARDLPGKN